jgi:predicted DNA-binding protein YlxM (UPF0122 family)
MNKNANVQNNERITQSELSRRLSVSRQAIHDLKQRGLLTLGDDGLFDYEQAKAEIAANLKKHDAKTLNELESITEPTTLTADSDSNQNGFFHARVRREEAEAGLKEITLQQKQGTLIDKASYDRAAMQTARILRDSLINNLPPKISASLAASTEPYACECLLRNAIRDELKTICSILDQTHETA